jgi:phosphate transport system substrate-binding protein
MVTLQSFTGQKAARLAAILSVLALVSGCGRGGSAGAGDAAKPAATKAVVSFQNTGSDTLVNLALAWAEAYMSLHPEVRISVTGGGSGTGIASLLNGTVQIANASREMSTEELATAKKNGMRPVKLTVALDAIAVVVHPSNPVGSLTLREISDIFTGKTGRWTDVGGENRPIVLLSRESNSGTYVYFLEQVIRLGRKGASELFSPETLLMPSSEGISVEVRQNPNAIGYDGLGYVTGGQKMIGVAREAGGPFVLPAAATAVDGSYPIARPLYMYTAEEPTGGVKEYLDWVMGDGQSLVKVLGFVPMR